MERSPTPKSETDERPPAGQPGRAERGRHRLLRLAVAFVTWLVILGNAGVIVWLWVRGGNVTDVSTRGDALSSAGRITGLLAAYLALLQVLILARIPWLERLTGFDRLTIWHRLNGNACIVLVLAHVVFTVVGYALLDELSIPRETVTMVTTYPGMITAWLGTAFFVAVTVSSLVVLRRRLPYEAWYAVHLTAYAAIALAWVHQIPTGNDLVVDPAAARYWRGLYLVSLALLVGFRVVQPLVNAFRFRLRVAEVVPEAPGVVSVRMTGRRLDRLRARPGQFFLWRFLTRGRWWAAHPFSLSAAPDGRSLRITAKALGGFSARLGELEPGTRVVAEGPFGSFTEDFRAREKLLLVAGGIGITPVRALLERVSGDAVVVYRVLRDEDVVFRDELHSLAAERGIALHYVVGDHAAPDGRSLVAPDHLRELVPDLGERDVYVCGPPAMVDALVGHLRAAGVPRKHVHVEKFAL